MKIKTKIIIFLILLSASVFSMCACSSSDMCFYDVKRELENYIERLGIECAEIDSIVIENGRLAWDGKPKEIYIKIDFSTK